MTNTAQANYTKPTILNQGAKKMSHFKNIKVNYTDFDGKRTSTTINFAICENLYWKKVEIETRRKLIEEENYQEKERKYAVDLYYPKKYIHTITLNIPNGYTIKNIDNLIFNKQLKDDENKEIIGSFTTIAKIEGNTLKISIEEFYNFTHLEKERYNEYRDLINTAFDFYKSSVVISK